ncbi:MAG: porin [Novosphingobium sp.]|nr:porin [Novosphingobium sp.]
MTNTKRIFSPALAPVALAVSLGWAMPARAQSSAEAEALRQEMAQMRAQMQAMAARIDALEGDLASANAKAEAAKVAATQAKDASKDAVKVSWKGAPQFEGDNGWKFKVRGRGQFDAGSIGVPAGTGVDDGFGVEVRRARLGVEGGMPGGIGYKFELDFAANEVEIADALVDYKAGDVKLTIGQHNNFQSLEELTSSRFTSFMERAAFTDAFNFERRVGVSAQYHKGPLLVQTGLFSDNLADIGGTSNNSYGGDLRVVFMPKLGNAQLHFGGSVHYRDFNDAASTVRYRQRPFVHFTGTRFINTGNIPAKSETSYGLELAGISGPFHFAGEAYRQKVASPGFADPTFFGGYAEVGYFLTKGDHRGYKNGIFDRVKPRRGFDKGGVGAVQINLRYDYLDLNDAGIAGGKQEGYAVSVIWTPTDYTRLMANYGRMEYTDAYYFDGADYDYGVDAFGVRAQFDF